MQSEKNKDYDKVLQVFVRANSAGQPLEYSDLLLATATAKWEKLDARKEIHDFTDSLNGIGNGYAFGKDFVLKACLYLSDSLPIQYKVKNFTKKNLFRIFLLGLTGMFLYHVLFFSSLKFTSSSNSALLVSLDAVFVTILAVIFLKEKLNWKQGMGVALAFLGSAIIMQLYWFRACF